MMAGNLTLGAAGYGGSELSALEGAAINKGVGYAENVAATGGQTIIREGMKRVSMEAAKRPGSVILNSMPKFTGTAYQVTSQTMAYNRQW